MQWIGAAVAVAALVGAIVWFGRDVGGQPAHGGGGGPGAPAVVVGNDAASTGI